MREHRTPRVFASLLDSVCPLPSANRTGCAARLFPASTPGNYAAFFPCAIYPPHVATPAQAASDCHRHPFLPQAASKRIPSRPFPGNSLPHSTNTKPNGVRFGNRRIQCCPHEWNAAHVQQHSQARKPCRALLSDQGCRLRHRATQIFPLPGPPEHPGRCPAQSFARRLPLQNRSPAFVHPSCPGIQKRTVYAMDRTHAAIISRSYPKYFDHTPNNVSPRMVTMRSPEKISGCSARMVWR